MKFSYSSSVIGSSTRYLISVLPDVHSLSKDFLISSINCCSSFIVDISYTKPQQKSTLFLDFLRLFSSLVSPCLVEKGKPLQDFLTISQLTVFEIFGVRDPIGYISFCQDVMIRITIQKIFKIQILPVMPINVVHCGNILHYFFGEVNSFFQKFTTSNKSTLWHT